MPSSLNFEDYTVAWLAGLPIEAEAALGILDNLHNGQFETGRGDDYIFIGGDVNGHNVVIATWPEGQNYGVGSAAALANQVKARFPNIWFALLVGVAAGLPNLVPKPPARRSDIRLGDVLVCVPDKTNSGIVHYDLGQVTDNRFILNNRQAEPPAIVRSAISNIKLTKKKPFKNGNIFFEYLKVFQEKDEDDKFLCPSQCKDQLFEVLRDGENIIERAVERDARDELERTRVWYGSIGSGNALMRNSIQRDKLRDEHDLIGLEMEAAGIMNVLPAGVIRGVCDYGDNFKNKDWQPYAAAVAAVYAKGILYTISPKASQVQRDSLETERIADEGLLRDLCPPILWARYDDVSEPHKDTFQWIFGGHFQAWADFPKFLAGDEGIYWVTGKAGSGKSTLMKYISEEKQKLERHLKPWAGGLPLSIVTFFFWNGGSKAQRSQEGLFRSLLHQFLRTQRKLIRTILPDQWQVFHKEAREGDSGNTRVTWSLSVLEKAFTAIMEQTSLHTKHFLLIDGLDEYEGNHVALIEMFKKLAKSSSVKMCLASRPWIIFENVFKTIPRLRLQDLTARDIRKHTNDNLYQGRRISGLRDHYPKIALELVEEIVQNADGVFLWVILVVRSLLEGFANEDELEDLQARLKLLPTELTELYRHMLSLDAPSPYSITASKIFLLRRASDLAELNLERSTPPPFGLLDLDFAMSKSPSSALDIKVASFSEGMMDKRCVEMEKKLTIWCKGLLEVSGIQTNRFTYIRYLHRTVKEYLESDEVYMKLIETTKDEQFEPHLCLLQACIMKLKCVCVNMSWDDNELPSTFLLGIMHAQLDENIRILRSTQSNPAETALLDELDSTMAQILASFMDTTNQPWFYQYGLFQRDRYRFVDRNGCQDTFLSLAVQFGLHLYLEAKVNQDRGIGRPKSRTKTLESQTSLLEAPLTVNKPGRPLLHCAIDSLLQNKLSILCPLGSILIPTLLRLGARPNEIFNGTTVWRYFLSGLYYLKSELSTQGERRYNLANTVKNFIEFGADLNGFCIRSGDGISEREWTPHELIFDIFKNTPLALVEMERVIKEINEAQELTAKMELDKSKTKRLKGVKKRFTWKFFSK